MRQSVSVSFHFLASLKLMSRIFPISSSPYRPLPDRARSTFESGISGQDTGHSMNGPLDHPSPSGSSSSSSSEDLLLLLLLLLPLLLLILPC